MCYKIAKNNITRSLMFEIGTLQWNPDLSLQGAVHLVKCDCVQNKEQLHFIITFILL